jgi:hypothetical protein
MRSIYEEASNVRVWLGGADKESEMAIELINTVFQSSENKIEPEKEIVSASRAETRKLIKNLDMEAWAALVNLLKRVHGSDVSGSSRKLQFPSLRHL